MNDPRIAFFDHHASNWDTDGPDIQTTLARLQQLQKLLDLRPGMTLLEVGCGTGQITKWLADQVHPGRVLAVDFSDQMLEKARGKGIHAEFRRADVCSEVLGEKLFDTVLCFHSFPHFRDKPAALRNLANALKPKGQLLTFHLSGSKKINDFHDHVGGAVTGDHLPDPAEWDRLLTQAGLYKTLLTDQPDLFFLRSVKDI
jgi:2-polyprenyl-3-methyl-5-hydroxy-6-metoxy-1,4-benzoquinol methylase